MSGDQEVLISVLEVIFSVPAAYIDESKTLKDMYEDVPKNSTETIVLANFVQPDTFSEFLKYMKIYSENPKESWDVFDNETKQLPSFMCDFFNSKNIESIYSLFELANYLYIDHLFNYCVLSVAVRIRGKTIEEMVKILGIDPSERDLDEQEQPKVNEMLKLLIGSDQ